MSHDNLISVDHNRSRRIAKSAAKPLDCQIQREQIVDILNLRFRMMHEKEHYAD